MRRQVLRRDVIPTRCHHCPLWNTPLAHKCIPTEICGSTDILFIGEAPGQDEDMQGLPWVGKAGKFLRGEIAKVGSQGYSLGNVVRCNPRNGQSNRAPTLDEIAWCRNYILEDIVALQPKVVVLLGATAISLFNKESTTVASVRGKPFKIAYEMNGQAVEFQALASYHPSAVLRTPSLLSLLSGDIQKAFEMLYGKPSDLQRWGRKGVSHLITSVAEANELVDFYINDAPKDCLLAVDYESQSLNRLKNVIATVGLSHDGDTGYVIPLQHTETPFNPEEVQQLIALMARLMATENPAFGMFVGHHVKIDLQFQSIIGVGGTVGDIWVPAGVLDTMLMAFSLDENRASLKEYSGSIGAYGLKYLLEEYLGFYHYGDLKTLASAGDMHLQPLATVSEYQGMDAYGTHRLCQWLMQHAEKQDYLKQMMQLAKHLTGRASQMLGSAEQRGMLIDVKQLRKLADPHKSPLKNEYSRLVKEIANTESAQKANDLILSRDGRSAGMKSLFGKPTLFDINNREHQKVLYLEVEGLEPLSFGEKKDGSRGDPRLNKEFLEHYEETCALIGLDQQRRGIKKLMEAYVNSTIQRLDPYLGDPEVLLDRSVHTSYLQQRAVTGRLASKNPNMQQIPKPNKKIPWRIEVRKMFVARPGYVLIQSDYSQAEVRWWAQIAGDKTYAEIFQRGVELKRQYFDHADDCLICSGRAEGTCAKGDRLATIVVQQCDAHRQAAALMHSIDVCDVTKDQRQGAKSFVFGSIYGRSIHTIAEQLGITYQAAQTIFDKFMGQFEKSANWLNWIEEFAAANGYVEAPNGRRRRLNAYISGNKGQIGHANRQARNAPIQGSASDMCLLAAIELYEKIHQEKKNGRWYILGLIHDSIVSEIPFEDLEEYMYMAEAVMLDPTPLKEYFDIDMIVKMEVEFEIGVNLGETETWGVGVNSMWCLQDKLAPRVEEMRQYLGVI